MKRIVAFFLAILLLFPACAHGGSWTPPVDQLSTSVDPGLFGWIEANRKMPSGNWVRDVTITVYVAGPQRLAGKTCIIEINDEHRYEFAPNASQSWTLSGPFAEGTHTVRITVGDVTRHHTIRVWRITLDGAIE